MYLLVYYLFEHFCMFFQIPSTFTNLRRFFKRLPLNQTLVASYLDLYLVQTFWHARLRLQDLNESGGIHHCWEVWFWRSQLRLSLRLNAKIIALLSYFIFPLSLQTLDRTRGQGHGVTVSRACHEVLTSQWPIFLMTQSVLLCQDDEFVIPWPPCAHCVHARCSLLIVASISGSRVTSLAWSPQPPIMSVLATNSGAQNTSTQLHLCV